MISLLDNMRPGRSIYDAFHSKRASVNMVGLVISVSLLVVCSLVIILMPVEMRGKVWIYNVLILPVLSSAFLFKGSGGTAASIVCIATATAIYKVFGNYDTAQGFGSSFLSSGMLVECLVYFVVGLAIDFADIIFGSFSGIGNEKMEEEQDKSAEILKLKKEISAKQAAIEENLNKVNFISSKTVTLQGIAREIGMCLNFEDLLKSTLLAINKLLKAKKISVFLKNEENKLMLKASYGWGVTNPNDFIISSEHEILMWSCMNNGMVVPEEINKDTVLSAIRRESKFKTLMCSPISHSNEVIGIISIEEMEAGLKITPDDIRLFSILIDFVSLSFKNSRLFRKVEMLANTDGLTKLYTHRFFQTILSSEIEKCAKSQKNFSIILSDIDHFKKFNDTYGHQAGDYVLEQTAACFKSCLRPIDVLARYGGEEFIALLPDTNVNGSYVMAERIRKAIEAKAYNFNNQAMKVTVSLGLATFPIDASDNVGLVKKSDLGLYYCKENGRNRVAVASMIPNLDELLAKKEKK